MRNQKGQIASAQGKAQTQLPLGQIFSFYFISFQIHDEDIIQHPSRFVYTNHTRFAFSLHL
jgi:hypothetical protein